VPLRNQTPCLVQWGNGALDFDIPFSDELPQRGQVEEPWLPCPLSTPPSSRPFALIFDHLQPRKPEGEEANFPENIKWGQRVMHGEILESGDLAQRKPAHRDER
jgi:hypothetical protein